MVTDFKKTLRDFAERNSQTKTWIGEVVTAPDADGKCKVRISGDVAQTCTAIGTVSRGDKLTVMRFPGSVRPVVVGAGPASQSSQAVALPLTVSHDLVAHALDGEFHTGSIRNDQGPQFALLTGERPFLGQVTINPPSATAPFVLGANAQGQLVTGLNADLLDGYQAAAFSLTGHNHTHAALLGLDADDHPQYLDVARHDTIDRHTLGTVVPHDDHGNLSGLPDDDHPQYAAIAQVETITGAWTFQATMTTHHIFPALTDTYDLGSQTAIWRKAWISELDAVIFALNTASIINGWLVVPKRGGALPQDVPAAATTIDFGQTMYANEFVVFRSAGQVEYMQVISLDKDPLYNVTRNLDGTGANNWPAGTVFSVYGLNGDGRVEIAGGTTPRVSVIVQGATYNAQTEIVRIGQLTGMPGISGSPHGIFIGDASQYLKYHDGALTIAGNGSGITNINGGNISLTSSISINSSTYGADGVQLQYNGGNPRAYIGNGADRYFRFDGTTISWQGVNAALSADGVFSASNAIISGSITATAGSLSGLTVSGLLSLNTTGELRAGDTTNGLRYGYIADGYYLRGVGGGTTQVEIRAADGKLYAGGGKVILLSSGIEILSSQSTARFLLKDDGGASVLYLYAGSYATGPTGARFGLATGQSFVVDLGPDVGADSFRVIKQTVSSPYFSDLFRVSNAGVSISTGLNVGSATGAATGQIKASDDVFALGRGKGLQGQIDDLNIIQASNVLTLTTNYQDVPGLTTGSFTPAVNEYAIVVLYVYWNKAGGTAICNASDQLSAVLDVYYSSADHLESLAAVIIANDGIGAANSFRMYKIALTAGTAYTLKVQARNATGSRGICGTNSHMMVWRVSR